MLAVYDQTRARAMLRDWTPTRLRAELRAGSFGRRLPPPAARELAELLLAWEQRALGSLPLRDALLIDSLRGERVYNLICAALTAERAMVSPTLAAQLPNAPVDLPVLPAPLAAEPALAALAARAAATGLALAWQSRPDSYPPPRDLDQLVARVPPPAPAPPAAFDPPSGLRRSAAAVLAILGVALLVMPLLAGHIPEDPAGLPLALLTLALLVGIRAGPSGLLGSACIWLVANLPGFRHGTSLPDLWPALPLLAAGALLLGLDRRVRAMWGWVRRQLRRDKVAQR